MDAFDRAVEQSVIVCFQMFFVFLENYSNILCASLDNTQSAACCTEANVQHRWRLFAG